MKQQKETKFVTVLSWVFMGFSGYSTTLSFFFFILFLFKPPVELLEMINSYIEILIFIPPKIITLLKNHYIAFSLFSLAFSITLLTVSFALLKRRNWARIFTVFIMMLTMALSITGLFFHDFFMLAIPGNEYLQEVIERMNKIIDIALILLTIVIVLLHGWLTWKLLSKPVRDEFTRHTN